jgi:hypothetical protein
MNRRNFLGQLAGVAGASTLLGIPKLLNAAQGVGSENRKLPNIVMFLVDDLGWGDFGCYGNTFHETPNIDKLARDGMKLTRAYAGAPVCSPILLNGFLALSIQTKSSSKLQTSLTCPLVFQPLPVN